MLKVLIVDDEPFIALGLSKLISWEQEGFSVVATAANGKEAYDYIENGKEQASSAEAASVKFKAISEEVDIVKENTRVLMAAIDDLKVANNAISANKPLSQTTMKF